MMRVLPSPTEYEDRFYPGPMVGTELAIAGVKGAYTILHMIEGCASMVNFLRTDQIPDGCYSPVLETGLQTNDVVMGGNEGLIEAALRQAFSSPRTEIAFVLSNCATSIIADDMKGAARRSVKSQGKPVVAIDTAGFLGGMVTGVDSVLTPLARMYAATTPDRAGLNLVAPFLMGSKNWPNDLEEMGRLLAAADVPVQVTLTHNTSLPDLERIGWAEANYVLCGDPLPEFDQHCQSIGLPRWGSDLVLPLGMHNTEEWYLEIASRFGNVEKAKAQLRNDWARVRRILGLNYNASWALIGFSNKRVGVLGFAPFAAALARSLFYDFNMRPKVVGLVAETRGGLDAAIKLLEPMSSLLDFEVLENPSYLLYGERLQEAEVVMSIGQAQDRQLSEGLSIPHLALGGFYFFNQFNFVPWPYFGVLGVLNLVSELWKLTDEVLTDKEPWRSHHFRPRGEKAPERFV